MSGGCKRAEGLWGRASGEHGDQRASASLLRLPSLSQRAYSLSADAASLSTAVVHGWAMGVYASNGERSGLTRREARLSIINALTDALTNADRPNELRLIGAKGGK